MSININYKMLNKAQYDAVTLKDEHSLVVSVPGSGKTAVLVNRIAHLTKEGVDPSNILAITFSRTAADNMVDKLRGIAPYHVDKMAINTFHAITYRLLKANVGYWIKSKQLSRTYEVEKLMQEIVIKMLRLESQPKDVDASAITHFITIQKNNLLTPNSELIDVVGQPYTMDSMKEIYKLWEKNKVKYGLTTFDDMIWEGYKLIKSNKAIRDHLQNKYKYIMVDESNDLTKLQYETVKLIGAKSKSISIIGDNSQEIFQFLGASNRYMKKFVDEFKGVKVINSNINYRSQGKIVDLYNNFLSGSPETKYKYYSPAKAFKPSGRDVEYNVFFDNREEAVWIANKINTLVKKGKYTYGDMMVLYRTNTQSQAFEEAFSKSEIPYHMEGGMSFYNRKEIKDMICYLKLINDQNDDEAWNRIINVPNRFFGNVFKEEVDLYATIKKCSMYDAMSEFPKAKDCRYKKNIQQFQSIIRKCKLVDGRYRVSTIIEMLRKALCYDEFISREFDKDLDNNKVENLISFTKQADSYKSIKSFLKSIEIAIKNGEDSTKKKHKSTKPKVQMKSMHCSKGDQAPVVFVVGFSEGLIPHNKNINIEAERLLGYVALSRAEEEMYVSSILNHNGKEKQVSSFLYNCFDEDLIEEKKEECYDRLRERAEINKNT